jgi:hypothetical protein
VAVVTIFAQKLFPDARHHQKQHVKIKPAITDAPLDELFKNYSQPGDRLGLRRTPKIG